VYDDRHTDLCDKPRGVTNTKKASPTLAPRVIHRSVSLLQLESFVAVAEEENLSRAARRLCVSQPPLTRRIQSLEDELGAPLFRRTARGMRLMPAGQSLLPHARQILDLARIDRVRAILASDPRSIPPR
jgi:DNA-binding transcriptional LysR family regulator